MSVETTPRPQVAPGRITQGRVLHSEWIKMRSVRSTRLTLAFAVAALIGLGPLIALFAPAQGLDPVAISTTGYLFAQLAVGALGVLVVSGEYSTGMIRVSLTAVPRRLPVLWAKTAVYAVVTWVSMTAAAVAAFLFSQAILASRGLATASLGDPGVARTVLGSAAYLTVLAVLSVAIGALTRATAGGVAAILGILLVLPVLTRVLPSTTADTVARYLPGNAGQAIFTLDQSSATLSPWAGLTVLSLYAGVALAGAASMLRRRDV
ncbi:ABC transporter permease [Streptomyces sp. NPDC059256]|uniref:ABC transporter permease n=1 Tax=Streptomyces sp. NPDC059256 TaxID=3346794 RepID=UPI0036B17E25